MISLQDRKEIEAIGKRHGVSRILLFGSSIRDGAQARDIDLAVEGLPASSFFAFYADLLFSLTKSVDLVDLDRKNKFTDLIRREGVSVYG